MVVYLSAEAQTEGYFFLCPLRLSGKVFQSYVVFVLQDYRYLSKSSLTKKVIIFSYEKFPAFSKTDSNAVRIN